jgi:hypothetical protein
MCVRREKQIFFYRGRPDHFNAAADSSSEGGLEKNADARCADLSEYSEDGAQQGVHVRKLPL